MINTTIIDTYQLKKLTRNLANSFLRCNLNASFNPPWTTSNCVKIVQNSVEVQTVKLKYKQKNLNNDVKVNR